MRISRILKLLISTAVLLPISAHANEATLLVDSPSMILLAATANESELVGRTVWVGGALGARETSTLKSGRSGIPTRLCLAYTKPTEFVSVYPRQAIDSGAIYSVVTARVKSLGAPDIKYVQVEEVAHEDLDADGRTDTVVLVFTERDRHGTSPEQPGDITAIFLVETTNGQPQIMDEIVIVAAEGGLSRTRHYLTPLAMARNPDSGTWNFLIVEEYDQWSGKASTSAVTADSQKTQPRRRWIGRLVNGMVYELVERKLRPVDGLRYGYGIASDY